MMGIRADARHQGTVVREAMVHRLGLLHVMRSRDAGGVHVMTWRRGVVVARVWREGRCWVLHVHDCERGTVDVARLPAWGVARAEARSAVQARAPRIVREALAAMRRGDLLLKPAGAAA